MPDNRTRRARMRAITEALAEYVRAEIEYETSPNRYGEFPPSSATRDNALAELTQMLVLYL